MLNVSNPTQFKISLLIKAVTLYLLNFSSHQAVESSAANHQLRLHGPVNISQQWKPPTPPTPIKVQVTAERWKPPTPPTPITVEVTVSRKQQKMTELGSDWECNELGFPYECIRIGRSGAFRCNAPTGCDDFLFTIEDWNPQTGEIYFRRQDQSCEFSRGLIAEYRATIENGAMSGERQILDAGNGLTQPVQLIGLWQDFHCSIGGEEINQELKESSDPKKAVHNQKGLSCEDCIRQYCPNCGGLVFCETSDPACSTCIDQHIQAIEACRN